MSLRKTIRVFLAIAILAVGSAAQARQVIGLVSFGVLGPITVENSPGNIATANLFSLANLIVSSGSGDFTGYSTAFQFQNFGQTTLYANNIAPFLTMSMPANFGAFFPTSVSVMDQAANRISYKVLGNWTPGSYFTTAGFANTAQEANWVFSFVQPGGPGTTISGSGTFEVSPVPEPSSMLLVGLGASGMVAAKLRRKKEQYRVELGPKSI